MVQYEQNSCCRYRHYRLSLPITHEPLQMIALPLHLRVVHVLLHSIVCVRSGHVGGVNNKKYLHENEIHFPRENCFIVLLLQHGRCEHTLYLELTPII